jgi:hypothetical protein
MTTYRVGPVGATVYDPDGTPLLVLQPGQIVVEGTTESAAKRLRGYDDKAMHPAADGGRPPAPASAAEKDA